MISYRCALCTALVDSREVARAYLGPKRLVRDVCRSCVRECNTAHAQADSAEARGRARDRKPPSDDREGA
jgi:hypothetical protein